MKKNILPSILLCLVSATAFAWQVAPPEPPIEERQTNWLAWVIGVGIAMALGIILYLYIKKNPRKDVQ